MSEGEKQNQEDEELAEVGRIVDEIARQIRQELSDNPEGNTGDISTAGSSGEENTAESELESGLESEPAPEPALEPGFMEDLVDASSGEPDYGDFLGGAVSDTEEISVEANEAVAQSAMKPESEVGFELEPGSEAETQSEASFQAATVRDDVSEESDKGFGAFFRGLFGAMPETALAVEDSPVAAQLEEEIIAIPDDPLADELDNMSREILEDVGDIEEDLHVSNVGIVAPFPAIVVNLIDIDIVALLNLRLVQQSPRSRLVALANDLPVGFPIEGFRVAAEAEQGGDEAFLTALADARSNAANIEILLCYAEALLAEQRGNSVQAMTLLDDLGRPALDNALLRYDLARLAELNDDLERAEQECLTLVNLSDDPQMQQWALAQRIALLGRLGREQVIMPLLRQLLGRLEASVRAKLLPCFYGLLERLEDVGERHWLIDQLLALPDFARDEHLLEADYHLAQVSGDRVRERAALQRLVEVANGEHRLHWLKESLALYEGEGDLSALKTILHTLWHAAEVEGDSACVKSTLLRLRECEPQNIEVFEGLSACYRRAGDDDALIEVLETFLLFLETSTRRGVLEELLGLRHQRGEVEASHTILGELATLGDKSIRELLGQTNRIHGDHRKHWLDALLERAIKATNAEMQCAIQQKLLSFAEGRGDKAGQIAALEALMPLNEETRQYRKQLVKLYREQGNMTAHLDMLGRLLEDVEDRKEQIALRQGRIALFLMGGERDSARAELEILLNISERRVDVLQQLLEVASDGLAPEQSVAYCREILDSLPMSAEAERAACQRRLSTGLDRLGRIAEALEVLFDLRGMHEAESGECRQITEEIWLLAQRLDLREALDNSSEVIEALRRDFPDWSDLQDLLLATELTEALRLRDPVRLKRLTLDALDDSRAWQHLLSCGERDMLTLITLLKGDAELRVFFERIAQEGHEHKIQVYSNQILASQYESDQRWEQAIVCWQRVAEFLTGGEDVRQLIPVQLRLYSLYRRLRKTRELNALTAELAGYPESVDERFGKYLAPMFEIYGVQCVREDALDRGIVLLQRALKLRQSYDGNVLKHAMLLGNLAETYLRQSHFDQARLHFDQAIAILKAQPEQSGQIKEKINSFRVRQRMIESHQELVRLQKQK